MILALIVGLLVAFMRAGSGAVPAIPDLVILGGLLVVANAGCVDLILIIVGRGRRRQSTAIIRARMGWLGGEDAEQADCNCRKQGKGFHPGAPIRFVISDHHHSGLRRP
ncbi:hypothetical protein EN809_027620 [Mesorhizobium sp. M2E.F.Ca.ET.166.01.1.1]|nr:hypothetical protein EN862_016350 [Mesorhizobium sp. M2E.F.Ca.ET.219.01.1.1]TGT68267.1 hypothetical protein EN809_027620 [Mesorhizobium sp. M2E.F.Ca.ET.166.01.1.1]TGW01270.1 hypothetical protein EN797_012930 [Mesorhizobium sp. M2E.F.Ca.ET.154.01.1.1]